MLSQPKRNTLTLALKEIAFLCIPIIALAPDLLKHQCFFANDLLGWFGPAWAFFKDSLAHGVFPLWNPYNFGGQPFAADPQSFAFYPFFYPFLIFPVGWGLTFFWGFHLFIAARGVGKWLENFGVSPETQLFGGALFTFSGLFRVELIHPTIVASLAWMPWCFAYLEKTFLKNSPRYFFLLSCSYSMLFLCGSFQIALAGFYGLWVYAFVHLLIEQHRFRLKSSIDVKRCILAFTIGLLPVFLVSIPIGEFVLRCSRNLQPQIYAIFNSRGSFDVHQLLSFFWPPSPGDQPLGEAIQTFDASGDNPLQALSGFMGPVAFFLALFALFRIQSRLTFPAATLSLVGFLWALGRHTPFHTWSCRLLPGFTFIQMPFRFLCLFTLGISIIAGLGFQEIVQRFGHIRPWKRPRLLAGLLCILGISLPLAVGWNFYITGPSKNYDFQTNSVFMNHLESAQPPYRVLWAPSLPYRVWYGQQEFFLAFPVNSCAPMKLRSATGYNPLCLENYFRLQRLPLDQFARILSSPLLVTENPISTTGFRLETSKPFFTYRLTPSTLAVKFPEHIITEPDDLTAFERMQIHDFNSEDQCVVTLPADVTLPVDGPPEGLSVKMIVDTSQHQAYRLEVPRDGLVVFPDIMFPGWKAKLDGSQIPILTAQSALRSVVVPKGTHLLEFSFHPFWWPWVGILLIAWFLASGYKILSTNK